MMRRLYKLPLRLRSLFHKTRVEDDLSDELRFHLEKQIEQNVAKGMTAEEARYAALCAFGGVEQVKEECRDSWGVRSINELAQDIRYGLRQLRRTPAVTAAVILSLALGIGVNSAVFGLVNGVLLRPLPVPAPNQVFVLAIQEKGAPIGSSGFSYPEFQDFRKQARGFSDLFALALSTVELKSNDTTDHCFINYVSGNFFPTLGVRPALGRLISPRDAEPPGGPVRVVLGNFYWRKAFGGDPGVLDKQILLDGKPATIIGVTPQEFRGVYPMFETDVYLPISAMTLEEPASLLWNSRDQRRLLVFGRLRQGTTIRRAQTVFNVIAGRLAAKYPASDKWMTVRAFPEIEARPIPYAHVSFVAIGGLFVGLAALVLLLACVNIENLLLARGTARQREMEIRAALGAGRGRMIRQLATETALLAAGGGAFGVFLGAQIVRLAPLIHPRTVPLQLDAGFDWKVFAYALGCTLAAGVLVGALPALRGSSIGVKSATRRAANRASAAPANRRTSNPLVIAQVAGSLVLLIAAGLFVQSLVNVRRTALGFDPRNVLNVVLDPHENGFSKAQTTVFYRDLEARVRTLPGVRSASLAAHIPMDAFPSSASVLVENRTVLPGHALPRVLFNTIGPSYFNTMKIAILRGRDFAASDDDSAPAVAIVNRTMADRFWPGENPLGKRFSARGPAGPFAEVVGVAENGKYQTIAENPQPFFYVPLAQNFTFRRVLQVRSVASPDSLREPVQDLIHELAPIVSVVDVATMQQFLDGAFGYFVFRFVAIFAGTLGLMGLVLAVIGVYAVVSYYAAQRTREIGVRVALGARTYDILSLMMGHGLKLVGAGVAFGLVAAWALSREMAGFFVEVHPFDPVVYAVVAILLTAAGLLACYFPARRATKVDPMVALRYE